MPNGQNGHVSLRILGPLEVHDPSGREIRSILAQPKRLALLSYLALTSRDQFRQRDTIIALFWPEFDQSRARGALRQALSWLRHELGGAVLTTRGEEEIGVTGSDLWCDAVAFDDAIAARDHERALELYRGHLLEGVFVTGADAEFEHWLDAERTRRHQQATRAATALAEREGAAGRMVAAVDWANRAAFLSPNDEDVHRRRLRLLAASGDRVGALAAHATFAERLAADYGTEPSPETARVVADVQASRGAAPPGIVAPDLPRSGHDAVDGGIKEDATKAVGNAPTDRDTRPADVAAALNSAAQMSRSSIGVTHQMRSWRWPAFVAIVAIAATTAAALSRRSPSPPAPPTRQQFTITGDASWPALSPDGRTIAFVKGWCLATHGTCNQELVMQDLDGEPSFLLTRGTGIHHPKWNPGGSYVLFQATSVPGDADTTSRGTYLVKRLGGNPQRIGPGGAAAFNNTGDTVVLASPSVVMKDTIRLRFLRSADREVFDSASVPLLNGGLSDLDWSPDGKWLALLVYSGQGARRVVLVSRHRGAVTDSMTVRGLGLVRWVPDGDAVLLQLQGGSSDDAVFRLGVDRRTGRFTSDTVTKAWIPAGGTTFDVSRDGTTLAVVDAAQTTTELIAMERDGERVTKRSLQSFTGWSGPAALSPDGSTIAVVRAEAQGANLYRIPFEGGVPRPITSVRDHVATPVWLRDQRLVFKRGLPSSQLFVVNETGGQPRPFGPVGYITGDPWYLQWLDDSLYVLDQRDHHRVLVVDSRGSIRDTLTVPDSLNQLLTVTPDSRQLWFFARDLEKGTFYSLDRATKLVKIAFEVRPNGGVVGWADGAYFVATWPNRTASSPTVWRVNPGGTLTQIAVLPAACDFRGLSMSRDGRRFVCQRTDGKSDIWLLHGLNLWR